MIYHALDSVVTRSEHHKGAGHDCGIASTGRGGRQRSTLQQTSQRDSVVKWADEDVEFVQAPDARLLGFARRFDVAYVPFQAPAHTKRFNPEYNFTGGLLDHLWVLESGDDVPTEQPQPQLGGGGGGALRRG